MLIVMRFQVEDEDTVTGARVVDGDEDEDEQGVETVLGRSKLRAAAEGTYLANTFEPRMSVLYRDISRMQYIASFGNIAI